MQDRLNVTFVKFKPYKITGNIYVDLVFECRADLHMPILAPLGISVEHIETGEDFEVRVGDVPLTSESFDISLWGTGENMPQALKNRMITKVKKSQYRGDKEIFPILTLLTFTIGCKTNSDFWHWIYNNWGDDIQLRLEARQQKLPDGINAAGCSELKAIGISCGGESLTLNQESGKLLEEPARRMRNA